MVDQAGDVLAGALTAPQAHVEGIERQIGAQRCGCLPAHDHPAEDVQDERHVGPARVCADVGQIGHPQLVRGIGDELALDFVFGSLGLSALAGGGLAGLLPRDPTQALGPHQPLDGAPGHADALAVELGVDLPGSVDTQVRFVSAPDVDDQFGVADRARRERSGLGGVVGARGDLHVGVLQDGADRLDPEPVAVLIDVVDQHRGGHCYLILRSSSAAAKKAALVFKISLARRNSRTSRSSSASLVASSVVVPGRTPPSISA